MKIFRTLISILSSGIYDQSSKARRMREDPGLVEDVCSCEGTPGGVVGRFKPTAGYMPSVSADQRDAAGGDLSWSCIEDWSRTGRG